VATARFSLIIALVRHPFATDFGALPGVCRKFGFVSQAFQQKSEKKVGMRLKTIVSLQHQNKITTVLTTKN
jgi:hypothetical protein